MFTLSIVLACLVALVLSFIWRLHWCLNNQPSFKIGRSEDQDWYMFRWYVIPRNPVFNIYLHKILRDDDPAALHDHPWMNMSWVLPHWLMQLLNIPVPSQGNHYVEVMPFLKNGSPGDPRNYQAPFRRFLRLSGSVVFRRATDAHRLELGREWLPNRDKVSSIPCWSLFFTGPKARKWGFFCARGWVPFDEYVKRTAEGNEVGAGCGEQT